MQLLDIYITSKTIFQRSQHEITELARRRTDQQGHTLYPLLVMDDDHYLIFRDYFREASAQIKEKCTAYIKNNPVILGEDTNDITGMDENLFLTLHLPQTFSTIMAQNIHNAIYNFLIAWVIYRWLEYKLPQEAILFRQKADTHLSNLNTLLEIRIRPVRRPYNLF